MLVDACASALGANPESEQGRWLTTISDPTEDEISSQNSPGGSFKLILTWRARLPKVGAAGRPHGIAMGVPPELPLASQLQVYGDAPEQTSELDEHHDDGAYDVDDQHCADDEHQDEATRGRRPKLVVAMAMFSLALAGTAGAFGYHAMISSARLPMLPPIINAGNQPTKIAPAANEQHAKSAANTSQVDTVPPGRSRNWSRAKSSQ